MSERIQPETGAAAMPLGAAPEVAPSDSVDAALPAAPSLSSAAIHTSAWTIFGFGSTQIIRLVSNLVMAKLLAPDAFGIMLILGVVMSGLQMFSDIGIGVSIIQNKRGEERAYLNTAWTLQVLRGIAIWIIACVIAYPVALIYKQPVIGWLLPAAALSAFIGGFNSTAMHTLNRRLAISRVMLMDIATQLIQFAVMLAWALLVNKDVWALIAGGLAQALARTILSHQLVPGATDRFQLEKDSVRSILHFGGWIFMSTVLTFCAMQADKLILAKLLDDWAMMGVFAIANTLVFVPLDVVKQLGGRVAFPAYSRTINEGGDFQRVFRGIRFPLCVVGGVTITGATAVAADFLHILYTDQYDDARYLIPWMGLGFIFLLLEATSGSALLARGQAKLVALGSGAKFLGVVALVPLGYSLGETHWPDVHLAPVRGALIGVAISELFRYLVSAASVWKAGLPVFRHDLGLFVVCVGSYWLAANQHVVTRIPDGTISAFVVKGLVVLLFFSIPLYRTVRVFLDRRRS